MAVLSRTHPCTPLVRNRSDYETADALELHLPGYNMAEWIPISRMSAAKSAGV
jgi:hypothetical protein